MLVEQPNATCIHGSMVSSLPSSGFSRDIPISTAPTLSPAREISKALATATSRQTSLFSTSETESNSLQLRLEQAPKRDKPILRRTLLQLQKKNQELKKFVGKTTNPEEIAKAQAEMSKNTNTIETLINCDRAISAALKGQDFALYRKDFPKFNLRSAKVLPFPGRKIFESVEHYLRTFEAIARSLQLDLEVQWKSLLPPCLPCKEQAWANKTLLHCGSWAEVWKAFQERFGYGNESCAHYAGELFSMTIDPNNDENIVEYSKKFKEVALMANFDYTNDMVAKRFFRSLTPRLQMILKITNAGLPEMTWNIDKMTNILERILPDLNYANLRRKRAAFNVNPVHVEKRQKIYSRPPKPLKFFCKLHKQNRTHSTEDCFSFKNK